MSMQMARAVMDRMNLREALIAPHYTGLMADLQNFAKADTAKEKAAAEEARVELLGAYGYEPGEVEKPFAFANGVAVIPVHGTLINRFGSSWGFITGYNFIRTQLNAAKADPDVELIVLDVNSYGGEAAGCFELSDDIYAARQEKPILAVIDSNCYSAAYAIGSAATKVVLTPSGGAGSIGVVAMHISFEKMLDEAGIEVTFIYSGAHKVDGNPYEKLPAEVKAHVQEGVDKSREKFVATVARNRGLDALAVRDTEAQIYRADDALALGLIDAIQPPSQAVAAFFSELSGSDQPEENDPMSDNANQPGAAQTAAAPANNDALVQTARSEGITEGANAERARTKAILTCEEAAGKSKLANELAFNTNLTPEQAKGILAAAATETAAAAPAAAAPAASAFHEAMNGSQNPNVGGDGGEGDKGEQSAAARILAAQSALTGRKFDIKTH
jgi:signal peptide peptidase SppA